MLLSIPNNKKAASVQTLCTEEVMVPHEAGTPNINVQIESKSNCKGWNRKETLSAVQFDTAFYYIHNAFIWQCLNSKG